MAHLANNFVFCLPDKRSTSNTNSEFEMRPKKQKSPYPWSLALPDATEPEMPAILRETSEGTSY